MAGLLAAASMLSLAAAYASPAIAGSAAKTLKEQLSDKASDEQRVDNCGVPPERRGPLPRPDCDDKPPPIEPAAGPDPVAAASPPPPP